MADTKRVDVKNITNGPKIFNGIPPQAIPAGQSLQDIEVSAGELESMRGSKWFEISGDASPELPALTGKNKAELLAIAKAEGAAVADDATNAQISDAIEGHRLIVEAYEADDLANKPLADQDKDQLLVVAAFEGADVPEGDDATVETLVSAIELHREG